jgi:toxin ParE1/3/4
MRFYALSSIASFDLKEMSRYISGDNPEAARRLIKKLRQAMNHLGENPKMGRRRVDLHDSIYSFPVDRYIIFYTTEEKGIRVMRVLHGARELSEIFFN